MKLSHNVLSIDPEIAERKIVSFIQDYTEKVKSKILVLGLSGGVDSAVCATLSVKAVGSDRVFSIYMPERETQTQSDLDHVTLIADMNKLHLMTVDLTSILDALYVTIPNFDPNASLCKGNIKARTRMLILYYFANLKRGLVVGSSDKSEAMIGYFTKWGDGAADIAPITDLYKTQIRELACYLKIPLEIINKPSTPGLLPNQIAEKDIGLKYSTLDLVLYGLERFMPIIKIAKQLGLEPKTVKSIKRRWLRNEHKRRMPLTAKLQYRTVNADFRLSQDISCSGE
jgi:NAD+ synthase